jgi:ribose transport system substrate-binding protein
MNILTKRIGCALLMGVLTLLVACERHSKSERFYLVATSVKHSYWQSAWAGFQKAADEYGVTVDMRGPDGFDPQAEAAAFRETVALKPSGILVQVGNEALMRPEIDAAVAAGIPVITIDSDAPQSHRLFFIGTNNLQAGRLGGARVAAQLKGKGNVVFFTIAGQPNLEERLKGYKDAFLEFPGIKVADVFDMKGDSGLAMDQAQQYLARTGTAKIGAVVCLESTSGKDVGEAFKRAGAGTAGTLLVAMDVDVATLNLVKDGTIDSTIAQKPFTMGLLGLKELDDVYHYPVKPLAQDYALDPNAPFPAFIDTGVTLVDKNNVDAILKNESGTAGGSQ